MKLLVMNDTHIRGTNPDKRIDDFRETLENKLKEIGEIITAEEIDYVIHGGDIFDRPDTAPAVVNQFIEIFLDYQAPIYTIVGNHDLYGHNPATLPRTMAGVLISAGIMNLIPEEGVILNKQGISLQLTGKSFDYQVDDSKADYEVKKREEVDYAIHLVHGMLLDKPAFPDQYTLIEDLDTEADITISGHYHLGYGSIKYEGQYFLNPGSLVRLGARMEELKRMPKVAIIELTSEDVKIDLKQLASAQKGSKVLDRSEIEADKVREKRLADFLREVKASNKFEIFSIQDILEQLSSEGEVDAKIKEAARDRIARAQQRLGGKG